MKLYFWNQQKFELNTIPEWSGYEPMVEVAKTSLDLIKDHKDFKTVHNIYLAFKEIDDRYGFSDAENIYHKNIEEVRFALSKILHMGSMLESAEDKKEKKTIQSLIDNFFTKAETLIRSLAAGVVSLDGTKSQGSPYFHITDPSQDVYTYKGRNFYLWNGWHSSKKVMEEMADKFFGEE